MRYILILCLAAALPLSVLAETAPVHPSRPSLHLTAKRVKSAHKAKKAKKAPKAKRAPSNGKGFHLFGSGK